MAHRQINVDEVWITSLDGDTGGGENRSRTCRQLRPIRHRRGMDAPDDVRGQSPVVGGIAYRKPLIERGVAPRHWATVVEISSNQVANAPSIAEVPGQLAEHRRVVHAVKIGAWQSAFWDCCSLHADFHRGPRRQQLYSPAEKRPRR